MRLGMQLSEKKREIILILSRENFSAGAIFKYTNRTQMFAWTFKVFT